MVADGAQTSCKVSKTNLEGQLIACFRIGGENRLCLPEVIKKVLFEIFDIKDDKSLNTVSDSLHIFFAECNGAQLNALKRAGVLPQSTARCGLVMQTDAERMCATLMNSCLERRPSPPEGVHIPVSHECFGGCRGKAWPDEYQTPVSWCIECIECDGYLSPAEFVAHSHGGREDHTCHWGFNSQNWRSYLMLSEDAPRHGDLASLQKQLNDMKLRFIDKEQVGAVQHKEELIGAKKSRLQLKKEITAVHSRQRQAGGTNVDCSSWKPVDVYTTWAACLDVVNKLRDEPNQQRSAQLPPYLYTGEPKLENPDHVVSFEDAYRYDRNYAPNVTLSTEPFDELRKLREAAAGDDALTDGDDCEPTVPVTWRRRLTQSSSDTHTSESVDDYEDTESVSSDKLEPVDEHEILPVTDDMETQLMTNLQYRADLIRSGMIASPQDETIKARLTDRFMAYNDQHLKSMKSLDWTQYALEQQLSGVLTTIERQSCQANEAKHEYDKQMSRIRQEGAAKMREAALERHKLLQQIEELSSASNMSDQALMAMQYKQEAEQWKRKLEESEATNSRLRQELAALLKILPQQQHGSGHQSDPRVPSPVLIMSPTAHHQHHHNGTADIW
jgi:hypothetical protein